MKNKYPIITAVVLIPIILVAGFMVNNRENAKKSIYDYIDRQGIRETQLKYADFHKDLKMGGYFLAVYVEGEKPAIYYEYSYRDNKVNFYAYFMPSEAIKQKLWGGRGLSDGEMEKLKYPPLN
jgi:hypothetical protein